MKTLITVASLALLLTSVPAANSQTIFTDTVKVSIPFDFEMDGTTYPAGDYTLRLNTAQHTVTIANAESYLGIHSTTNLGRDNSDGKTRLVFTEEKGKHILHQIWIAGDNHGHDLRHLKVESDLK